MIDDMVAPEVAAETANDTPVLAPAPSKRRRRIRWSFVLAGLAIAAAVIYLIVANTSTTAEYYMTINELRTCQTCSTRAVRVAGVVASNSIVKNDAAGTMRFVITEGKDTLPVTYNGIVPDIFRPGITVVVEGKLASTGVFNAQTLLAKCPSKFQSATPGASQS